MEKITKDNLESFIAYYHDFHDSNITNINYDLKKSQITILIDVFWSGKPLLKGNGYYESNKTKLKMILDEIKDFHLEEQERSYISESYIKYIKLYNKEFLCFATDCEKPFIYVVCDKIEYEEIK